MFEDVPGLGFLAVGVLEQKDDVRDGADNLGLVGVVLLVLITGVFLLWWCW